MYLVFALVVAVVMPSCKSTSALEKAREREYKEKMAEYKKGGWSIYGTSHTFEVALLEHYEKLKKEGAQELTGVASSFVSKNVGMQSALNSAYTKYAREAQSFVRGRAISEIFSDADNVPVEFDKFCTAYETIIAKEIKGDVKPSYYIIRSKGKNEKGQEVFEMQAICIVNQNEASKARIEAMENAMKESKLAEEYASKVSDFIREGFKVDNNAAEE